MNELFYNRDVTADWHVMQSRRLIDVAFSRGSSTALVYAALEARNALERLVFEMSVLATGGSLRQTNLALCRKRMASSGFWTRHCITIDDILNFRMSAWNSYKSFSIPRAGYSAL